MVNDLSNKWQLGQVTPSILKGTNSTQPHGKPPNHRRERLRMRPTRGREAVHCGGKRNGNGNGGRERAMESQQTNDDAS